MKKFKNASVMGSSYLKQFLFLIVAIMLSVTAFSRLMVKNLALSVEYIEWVHDRLKKKTPLFVWRESVWRTMMRSTDPQKDLVVWEFGVAWGYTTNWWLKRFPADRKISWRGFDRFTGLPRAWRSYDKGAFDAGGQTPDIDDNRVTWHVGNVEETLPTIDIQRSEGEQWIILFDLDIFEPTQFAFNHLKKNLRSGDILYFDEAVDDDERRVLDELVLPFESVKFELLALNPVSLAIRVV